MDMIISSKEVSANCIISTFCERNFAYIFYRPNYIIVFHFSNYLLGACKLFIIFVVTFEFLLGT